MKGQDQIIRGSINFPLKIGKSQIHGNGAYSVGAIPAKKKIGTLAGAIISKAEARKKAAGLKSVSIVELWNGKALDATRISNGLKFINHSCDPNTYMRNIGNLVEFYALRNIKKHEELTCNYGPTHHEGKKECKCGAYNCKGFL
jgi:uncharacterized protein